MISPQSSSNRSATQTQWLKSQVSLRLGKRCENGPCGPGISKAPHAVRLMRKRHANPPLQLQHRPVEILCFRQAPGIRAAMHIKEERLGLETLLDLLAQ